MKTFEFSIIASGLDPHADDFESKFYDAGCDDLLVAFQKGHIIIDFARESASLDEAISSAIEDVTKTGAKVERVEPDPLVSLSDISARTGLTRSAISHYHKGARGKEFPAPIAKVTSPTPLWDWATVARWMYENEKIDKDTAIEAEIFRCANAAIDDGNTHLADPLKKRATEYSKELEAA